MALFALGFGQNPAFRRLRLRPFNRLGRFEQQQRIGQNLFPTAKETPGTREISPGGCLLGQLHVSNHNTLQPLQGHCVTFVQIEHLAITFQGIVAAGSCQPGCGKVHLGKRQQLIHPSLLLTSGGQRGQRGQLCFQHLRPFSLRFGFSFRLLGLAFYLPGHLLFQRLAFKFLLLTLSGQQLRFLTFDLRLAFYLVL